MLVEVAQSQLDTRLVLLVIGRVPRGSCRFGGSVLLKALEHSSWDARLELAQKMFFE
jgi:hypothetical protein